MDQLTFDALQQTDEERFAEAVKQEMLSEPGYAPYIITQNNKGYVSVRAKKCSDKSVFQEILH